EDPPLRGPLPRLVGRDPLVGPSRAGRVGPGRRADAGAGVERHAAGRRDHADHRHVERHGRPRAHLRRARLRDRGRHHRADHGQHGRHHAGARLPRADARAGHGARRAPDLRRGADGHAGRPGRRAGAPRGRSRPDGTREGARRRRARRRPRRPPRHHGDGDRRAHDARGHVQLEPARVRGGDRGRGRDGRPRVLRGPRAARAAAGRRPGRGGGRDRYPGLLERHRRPLPAVVRARAADRLPHRPRHRPGQPLPASLRRAAGARRPDPAAAGGPLLRLRRPHRRRHRPHARGGGRDHARGGRGDRARRRRPDRRRAVRRAALAAVLATVLVAAGCGGSGSGGSGSSGSAGTPVNGGTLRAGIPDNPDYLDPGLSYTNEGWEILEATNNGLLTFKKAAGGEGAQIVPDIASAMPAVTDGGKTYTFQVRPDVMFSPPVNRAVQPSDFKFSIERLFRIDSGGLSFFTGIEGANAYAKSRTGGISGIVANDARGTITFHLTQPDGTFLDYMATPFAFVLPAGTPSKDISTLPQWRIATGPYRVSSYTPKQQLVISRNPNFHQWTSDSPNGHLSQIDVHIGVTPEQSVNEIADGQLDWYFEAVPPD